MMAALTASEHGHQVTVLERNERLGKKLFITGKGRCNVTNSGDMEALFANVITNEKFLYSAFYQYDNRMLMEFFEKNGCPLKEERGERVFPVSDKSGDIITTLQNALRRAGVKVRLNTRVDRLIVDESEEGAVCRGVVTADGERVMGDAVIVCTGGVSYPLTGSTGDGHRFAEETGHKVTELKPALVPLKTAEEWCPVLMGLSLKNVSLRMVSGGKEIYSGFGEMLFTHFGVSGPLVLSASSYYVKKKKGETFLYLDLKPALDIETLDKRLLRDFEENKNKQFRNALDALFPNKLIPVMVMLSGIPGEKRVNEITREERRAFAALIKEVPMTVTGTGSFAEAIITQGGVSVKDVNPSTMESKRVKSLYFAGEVLDLDAMTGGFNLQIAWSTGHLAGESIL